MTTQTTEFRLFQVNPNIPEGTVAHRLWEMVMPRKEIPDLPVTADNAAKFGHQVGMWRFSDKGADRINYDSAYFTIEHSDPGHHGFVKVIRFAFSAYGKSGLLLNDRFMTENPFFLPVGESQGLPPYGYETEQPGLVDRRFPGAIINVFHLRTSTGSPTIGAAVKNQHLFTVTIPKVDARNPKTKWWYQLNGLVVAVNEDYKELSNPEGCVAKLIISGLQGNGGTPAAYMYALEGIKTATRTGDGD